jgi:hypothetical protein
MKYHAIRTMKANEYGQILRGPPAPIFFKIQYFSLHYVFFPHNKLTTVARTVLETIGFLHSTSKYLLPFSDFQPMYHNQYSNIFLFNFSQVPFSILILLLVSIDAVFFIF